MSLIKGTSEFRTIIDFSQQKLSKNLIAKSIRNAEVLEAVKASENSYTFIHNSIKVGQYNIHLVFPYLDASQSRNQLRQYGKFKVEITVNTRTNTKKFNHVNLKSPLFKEQPWANLNDDGYNLRMKDLPEIVMYFKRLENLAVFN